MCTCVMTKLAVRRFKDYGCAFGAWGQSHSFIFGGATLPNDVSLLKGNIFALVGATSSQKEITRQTD